MCTRITLPAAIVLALTITAQAQETTANIAGRLQAESGSILHGYVVELETLISHNVTIRADVQSDGDFSLRGVPYGDYTLRVTTYYGNVLIQQLVNIHEHTVPLEIRLPSASRPAPGGTVSLAKLRHPPARKAIDAAIYAQRLSTSGRYDRAAGELERAVQISPDYADAHTNLGVVYLHVGRFEDAHAEILRALDIAGPNPRDLTNLAFALAALQRLPEATDAARRALAIDRHNAPAHYVLGEVLALSPATRAEGVAHLETAARSLECARRALEKLRP
jgi:tetratricopeptide (TPR) repeat protein